MSSPKTQNNAMTLKRRRRTPFYIIILVRWGDLLWRIFEQCAQCASG